jgi:hypothetical protein
MWRRSVNLRQVITGIELEGLTILVCNHFKEFKINTSELTYRVNTFVVVVCLT